MNSEAYEVAFGRYHNEEVRKLKPGYVLFWVDDNQDGGWYEQITIEAAQRRRLEARPHAHFDIW
jgi:hypothetical protein